MACGRGFLEARGDSRSLSNLLGGFGARLVYRPLSSRYTNPQLIDFQTWPVLDVEIASPQCSYPELAPLSLRRAFVAAATYMTRAR